jgi:hypothetical protein
MWSPFRSRRARGARGATEPRRPAILPALAANLTVATAGGRANLLSPDRPKNIIGLISDLTKNPDQAATFMMMVRGFVGAFCRLIAVVGAVFVACLIVITSSKGVTSLPLHYTLPIGISGGSLLTFIGNSVARRVRKRLKFRSGATNAEGPGKSS